MAGFWRRFAQEKRACFGATVLLLWLLLGSTATILAPRDPNQQQLPMRNQPPSPQYPLGTDQFGRDLLSRLLHGTHITLGLALGVASLALVFGTLAGLWAGYQGGIWDQVLMRFVDVLLAFPLIYLLIICVALFGNRLPILIAVMAATAWMDIARLVRAEALSLKEQDFVKAVEVLGFGRRRILLFHLLPNVLAPVLAVAVLRVADVMLIESSLSFLGLGVQTPAISWGSIIRDGRDALLTAWWIATFPGLAIMFTAIALHWTANGLRKALA